MSASTTTEPGQGFVHQLSRALPLPALGHVAYLLAWALGGALLARWCFTRRLVD